MEDRQIPWPEIFLKETNITYRNKKFSIKYTAIGLAAEIEKHNYYIDVRIGL